MRYQSSPSRYRHSSRPRSTQRGGSVALNESRKYYSDKRLEAYNNIVKNVMKDDTNHGQPRHYHSKSSKDFVQQPRKAKYLNGSIKIPPSKRLDRNKTEMIEAREQNKIQYHSRSRHRDTRLRSRSRRPQKSKERNIPRGTHRENRPRSRSRGREDHSRARSRSRAQHTFERSISRSLSTEPHRGRTRYSSTEPHRGSARYSITLDRPISRSVSAEPCRGRTRQSTRPRSRSMSANPNRGRNRMTRKSFERPRSRSMSVARQNRNNLLSLERPRSSSISVVRVNKNCTKAHNRSHSLKNIREKPTLRHTINQEKNHGLLSKLLHKSKKKKKSLMRNIGERQSRRNSYKKDEIIEDSIFFPDIEAVRSWAEIVKKDDESSYGELETPNAESRHHYIDNNFSSSSSFVGGNDVYREVEERKARKKSSRLLKKPNEFHSSFDSADSEVEEKRTRRGQSRRSNHQDFSSSRYGLQSNDRMQSMQRPKTLSRRRSHSQRRY